MRLLLVACIASVLAVPAALADNPPPPPPPTPQQQAAIDTCKAKGYARGSDAFNQCIASILGAPPPPQNGPPQNGPPQNGPPAPQTPAFAACQSQGLKPGSDAFNACVKSYDANRAKKPSPTPTPAQQAAIDACKAKGLAAGSTDFQNCLKDETTTGGAPNATAQAAIDGCKASGVPQRTDAFKACVRDATAAASVAGWTGEQLAALNACKAAGDPFGSNAMAACLSKALTKLLPGKGKPAEKEVNAVMAACQAKKLTGPDFQACVKAGLGS